MKKQIGFLRTTAIGGLLFLLPLIVIGYFAAQLIYVVYSLAVSLKDYIPVDDAAGIAILVGILLGIIILICFAAGIAARRAIGRKFSQFVEKYLTMFFPRYTIVKAQMSRSIGEGDVKFHMEPILANFDDFTQMAFEVERTENSRVVVYLPGAPDPWSGQIIYLKPEQVERLSIDFSTALSTIENMGRDSDRIFESIEAKD